MNQKITISNVFYLHLSVLIISDKWKPCPRVSHSRGATRAHRNLLQPSLWQLEYWITFRWQLEQRAWALPLQLAALLHSGEKRLKPLTCWFENSLKAHRTLCTCEHYNSDVCVRECVYACVHELRVSVNACKSVLMVCFYSKDDTTAALSASSPLSLPVAFLFPPTWASHINPTKSLSERKIKLSLD